MFSKKDKLKDEKDELNKQEIPDVQEQSSEEAIEVTEALDNAENALKEEIEKLDDKLKRSMAEFDNFRKRTIKEKSTMYDDGVRTTIEKILPVLDNLERAIATDAEISSPSPIEYDEEELVIGKIVTDNSAMRQGLEMILRQFIETLNSIDVKEIDAQNKEFDPKFHLAVAHVEDEAYEPNTVIEVLQKGYIHKDKVIRYSTVKVAN